MRIVMLCGDGLSSRIMFNALKDSFDIEAVIIEEKIPSKIMISRRIKKLGLRKTIGQILFLLTNKVLYRLAKTRKVELIKKFSLNENIIPENIINRVDSVNSQEAINLIKKNDPDVIIVNGTRIISNEVLCSINVPFINTHMGITPKYRGVHGGYWALANGDSNNCGVTVHLVDKGIDTGGILYQDIIYPEKQDNFNTYPIHQIAKAIPLMKKALLDAKENQISIKQNNLPSYLWYHPTLLEYMTTFIKIGVK